MQMGVIVSPFCHLVVRVIDPATPAQRKRQCLKFLLETIMYLTLKHGSACAWLLEEGIKKKNKKKKEKKRDNKIRNAPNPLKALFVLKQPLCIGNWPLGAQGTRSRGSAQRAATVSASAPRLPLRRCRLSAAPRPRPAPAPVPRP